MTIKKLAELVANDFQKTMDEGNFKNFKEMCSCYDWDAQQIKEEVFFVINEIAEETREEILMYDDYSTVIAGGDDMSWKDFKKIVFDNLK